MKIFQAAGRYGCKPQAKADIICLESVFLCMYVSPLCYFARYTYGKPVQGSVKAVVCRKHIQYKRKSPKAKRSICKEYTGKVSTWAIHYS